MLGMCDRVLAYCVGQSVSYFFYWPIGVRLTEWICKGNTKDLSISSCSVFLQTYTTLRRVTAVHDYNLSFKNHPKLIIKERYVIIKSSDICFWLCAIHMIQQIVFFKRLISGEIVLCDGYNYNTTIGFDGRSTDYQRSLRSKWRNTGRWPASRGHADLHIYLGCSARSSNGRSAVELQSNRSCNHRSNEFVKAKRKRFECVLWCVTLEL